MKKVAIILDGAYVQKLFYKKNKSHPGADDIIKLAKSSLQADEELFRIYYYDCPPFEGVRPQPISGKKINFSQTPVCSRQKSLHSALATMDHVAFRKGVILHAGWKIKKSSIKDLSGRSCDDSDMIPDFKQKGVDMRIGLDVAWLASKQIVDRIILFTGDSDFIPAMKFARREGVQMILVPMDSSFKREMREHADEVRKITF